jgi:hypothetical protein
MRTLPPLLLLVALSAAKPGPDTALRLEAVEPIFRARVVERPGCPPSFDVELTEELPDSGWTLALDRVQGPDAEGRFTAEITAARGDGAFAQVLTPRTVVVPVGFLRKGAYLLDLRLRRDPAAAYERVQALVLRGR